MKSTSDSTAGKRPEPDVQRFDFSQMERKSLDPNPNRFQAAVLASTPAEFADSIECVTFIARTSECVFSRTEVLFMRGEAHQS